MLKISFFIFCIDFVEDRFVSKLCRFSEKWNKILISWNLNKFKIKLKWTMIYYFEIFKYIILILNKKL